MCAQSLSPCVRPVIDCLTSSQLWHPATLQKIQRYSSETDGYRRDSRNTSSVSTMLIWTKTSRQLMTGFILYRHSGSPEDETWLWWSPLPSFYTQDLKICVINNDFFFFGSIKQMSRQTECCSGGADRSHRQMHRQPWRVYCQHNGELSKSVRGGRSGLCSTYGPVGR